MGQKGSPTAWLIGTGASLAPLGEIQAMLALEDEQSIAVIDTVHVLAIYLFCGFFFLHFSS